MRPTTTPSLSWSRSLFWSRSRSRSRLRRWVVPALVSVFVLVGCTEAPSVVRSPADAGQPSGIGSVAAGPPAAPNPDLSAQKKAAGIADCPVADAAAVPDGLPDATVPCLGGGRAVRLSGLRGPLLVNLWAQWCAGCREEAPYLAQVADRGSALRILGVDHADPQPALALTFAQQAGWTYPQLYDADLVFRTRLQVTGLPVTFFVRGDGTIAGRHAGAFTSVAQIEQESRRLLGVTP